MEKFINIKDLLGYLRRKRVMKWIDKFAFPSILLIWVSIIVLFGFIYSFFQNGQSYLYYVSQHGPINEIRDAIYFSFVTATTTGFGDIIPVGMFKWVAVFEVIFGLLLLATVTSKLVSIKQDIILNELYESSLSEKVNRLRSSLLLFRQNLHRLIDKIGEGIIKKREIENIYIYLSSFEDTMNEMINMIDRPDEHLTKGIGPVNTGLIFNGVLSSFETLNELIVVMTKHKLEWKRDINLKFVEQCLITNDKLFEKLDFSKGLLKQTIDDMNEHKNEIIALIRKRL